MADARQVWNLGNAAEYYVAVRPRYSKASVERVLDFYHRRCPSAEPLPGLALDVGCGSGQFTALLASYCRQVIGIDSSSAQIALASGPANTTFLVGSDDNLGSDISPNSVDLIVSAEAAHYFNLPKFYTEVERCLRPGGVLCLLGYLPKSFPAALGSIVNEELDQFLWVKLADYWPAGYKRLANYYVDMEIPYPGEERYQSEFIKKYTADEFLDYLRSMSCFTAHQKANPNDKEGILEPLSKALKSALHDAGWKDFEMIFREFGVFCQKPK